MLNKSATILGTAILAAVLCVLAYNLFVPQVPSYNEVKDALGSDSQITPIYSQPFIMAFGHPLFQRIEGWEFTVWVIEKDGSRTLGGDIYSEEDLALQDIAVGKFEAGG